MRFWDRAAVVAVVLAGLASVASPVMAATEARIVRQTSTANWATPSSDPTGITYDPRNRQLLISDSEVDENTLWRKRNLFRAGRAGGLLATRRVTKVSFEPEGIVWYSKKRWLLVTDDDRDAIFRMRPGRDGKIGTGDDLTGRLVNTRRYGSFDPEGIAWRPSIKMLLWVDATDGKVYKLRRGADRRFGTNDDKVAKFGTFRWGFTDPEGVTFDAATGHLFLASSRNKFLIQATMGGRLVRKIGMPWCGSGCNISDLVFAPGTDGSRRRLYLTDRGRDNDVFPDPADHNDGKIYQVRFVKVP